MLLGRRRKPRIRFREEWTSTLGAFHNVAFCAMINTSKRRIKRRIKTRLGPPDFQLRTEILCFMRTSSQLAEICPKYPKMFFFTSQLYRKLMSRLRQLAACSKKYGNTACIFISTQKSIQYLIWWSTGKIYRLHVTWINNQSRLHSFIPIFVIGSRSWEFHVPRSNPVFPFICTSLDVGYIDSCWRAQVALITVGTSSQIFPPSYV